MKSNLENKEDISYESPGKFEDTRFEKIITYYLKTAEASIIVARDCRLN
jgi:glucosamine-6-phosphate deaminase